MCQCAVKSFACWGTGEARQSQYFREYYLLTQCFAYLEKRYTVYMMKVQLFAKCMDEKSRAVWTQGYYSMFGFQNDRHVDKGEHLPLEQETNILC